MINSVVKLEGGEEKLVILRVCFHLKLHLRIQHQKPWMGLDWAMSVNATEETVSYRKGVIHYTITLWDFFFDWVLAYFLMEKSLLFKRKQFFNWRNQLPIFHWRNWQFRNAKKKGTSVLCFIHAAGKRKLCQRDNCQTCLMQDLTESKRVAPSTILASYASDECLCLWDCPASADCDYCWDSSNIIFYISKTWLFPLLCWNFSDFQNLL